MTNREVETTPFDLVIEPGAGVASYWRDLWRYRELVYFLAWRDVLVRYKQTGIGIAWSVLRPALTIVVLSVIFGRLAKFPAGGRPYPLFVLAAFLPWQLFANAFSHASNSLVANASMLTKVYFPRMISPIASIVANLVDFVICLAVLAVLMAWYGMTPDWRICFLPAFVALAVVCALGISFLFSALMVKYRDFQHILPFSLQLLLYVSPIGFSSSVISNKWKIVYSINPIVGVVDGFRWSLLRGAEPLQISCLAVSTAVAMGIFFVGVWWFRKAEPRFADWI